MSLLLLVQRYGLYYSWIYIWCLGYGQIPHNVQGMVMNTNECSNITKEMEMYKNECSNITKEMEMYKTGTRTFGFDIVVQDK